MYFKSLREQDEAYINSSMWSTLVDWNLRTSAYESHCAVDAEN